MDRQRTVTDRVNTAGLRWSNQAAATDVEGVAGDFSRLTDVKEKCRSNMIWFYEWRQVWHKLRI
jgi:hypothetical protein